MVHVTITTDGSCLGNPGPGGWAAIMRCGKLEKEIAGYERESTNNKMELRAVIEGFRALKQACNVTVRVDSTYVLENAQKDFDAIEWKTKSGKAVANASLLKELKAAMKLYDHSIEFVKVPAHSGDPDNERCDKLARNQIKENLFKEVSA